MRRLFIILNVIIAMGVAKGQMDGYYYFNISNKDIDCDICMKDGSYIIEIVEGFEFKLYTTLSYGTYSIIDNEVILKDANYGFITRLRSSFPIKSISVEQGFVFSLNKTARWVGKSFEPISKQIGIDSIAQKKERESYLQLHKEPYPIEYGLYESKYNCQINEWGKWVRGNGLELTLEEDNRYTLCFKKILILQGTWQRNGNEIALYDENLNHTFYILVDRLGLNIKYLPGEFEEGLFLRHVYQPWLKKFKFEDYLK